MGKIYFLKYSGLRPRYESLALQCHENDYFISFLWRGFRKFRVQAQTLEDKNRIIFVN